MSRKFEDYFSELQTDMVSICLEYVKNQGDNIYIYCSYENNMASAGFFYEINGRLVERHKIDKVLPNCDSSVFMQKEVMKILMDDLKKIKGVCDEFERPMPTEIKLSYDIKNNSLNAKYSYDLVHSIDSEKTASDIEMEWFKELEEISLSEN